MGLLQKLRNWCPQPLDPFTTKLKRHSAPIAALLMVSLFAVTFSVLSATYLFNQAAPVALVAPVSNVAPSTSYLGSSIAPAVEWQKNLPRELGIAATYIIQTSDGAFAIAGYDQTPGFPLSGNYYVVKTEPALPPPPPTPTPSSPPSTGFLSGENLVLFASSALAVILIVLVAVAVLRRRKKQTLAII